MNTNLNLYPDKMKNQCINAVSLLSDANEAWNRLKFEINEFVNDSYIHSVSFDELKKQCQNYTTVIDAMISCNEADIADFGILESVLDGVHEDLIGEKIDYWEKYYQALISKYNSLLDSGVHSQLQAYFGTLLSTYQELYNMWYAKELLYYEVDEKTSSLFTKSYGRLSIQNMLEGLKASFTLSDGYNSSIVAALAATIKNIKNEAVHIEPEVKAEWDALINSGKSFKEAEMILTDIFCANAAEDTCMKDKNGYVIGGKMEVPKPGDIIQVSLGIDTESINARVSSYNCWSIEFSIEGCRANYPKLTTRLNSALNAFENNSKEQDLLKLEVDGVGECYAGAMIEGFGKIGDIAEVTLNDGEKFNFMILDTKSNQHPREELVKNSSKEQPQCQNEWGHGYMVKDDTVQLSICEFIVTSNNGKSSAIFYPSGAFLNKKYVVSAEIIGHANEVVY